MAEKTSVKIAINTRVLAHPTTGVERYLIELLARMGPDIYQCAPHSALGGVKGHAWEQLVLPAKLRGRLLFSPCNTGPLAVANQVVTIHDVAALDHPEWLNAKFALWYRWLTLRLARRVKHIIAVSEFTRDRIVAHTGVSAEKITVIPNGVDARFAPMAPDAIDAALAPLALPSRKYILAVGSIEPRKNLPRLLEAWGKILPTLPEDLWLVVAGGRNARVFAAPAAAEELVPARRDRSEKLEEAGGYRLQVTGYRVRGEKLEVRSWKLGDASRQVYPAEQNSSAALPENSSRLEVLGSDSLSSSALPQPPSSYLLAPNSSSRVHYTGRVAEGLLPALYAGAMAFAYVSVYEGFGLPPLEAMAAGVPVLTGNLTSLPEVVGDAGIMVDPMDVDAIANGLRQLVDNAELRARLSGAGIDRAKRFTWERAAEATAAALRFASLQ